MNQLVELGKGRVVKSKFLRNDLLEKYKGFLRHLKEEDIRRLVLKMLILRILKESFST